jgi:hypothetical protein
VAVEVDILKLHSFYQLLVVVEVVVVMDNLVPQETHQAHLLVKEIMVVMVLALHFLVGVGVVLVLLVVMEVVVLVVVEEMEQHLL